MPIIDGAPEPRLKFYVDVGLGRVRIPQFLRDRGCHAETKMNQFGKRHVPDTEWLTWCGSEWIGLTKDESILRTAKEAAAVARSSVRLFYFPNANLGGTEYLAYLDQHWDRVLELADLPGPVVHAIYSDRVTTL